VWRIVIRYASPAPAACKGGSVQPAVVVHVVLVRRGRGMSDFRTGEWVGMSAGCGLGLRGSRSQQLCKYII